MKHFKHGNELAKEIGCSPDHLAKTFKTYTDDAK
jgi:AraC-like DNA-binding protein